MVDLISKACFPSHFVEHMQASWSAFDIYLCTLIMSYDYQMFSFDFQLSIININSIIKNSLSKNCFQKKFFKKNFQKNFFLKRIYD